MRSRHDPRVLNKLLEVRQVQRLGAEMEVARADNALRSLQSQREAGVEAVGQDVARWRDAVSAASLGLPQVRSWSAAVAEGEASLRALDIDIAEANDERSRTIEVLAAAQAREEVAEDVARLATRSAQRARDEARLSEQADRAAQRGHGR